MRTVKSPCRTLLAFVAIWFIIVQPDPALAQYVEPAHGTVVDPFRPPQHFGGPGNRGWEYATTPGSPILAAGNGVVTFAGPIGGALYVSISHADGLRTTYSRVRSVVVRRGDVVTAGSVIARAEARFHFGVIDNGTYVDPGSLFAAPGSGAPMLVRRQRAVNARTPLSGPVPVSGRYQ